MSITIVKLNHKGEGVAAGMPPVRRVLPEEVVDAEGRILTPSPDRVAAPCRHYKSCGGCAMQHASDEFVARWKTDVIRQGLAARGLETEIRPIAISPTHSRRRATLHGRRTKSGTLIGYFAPASEILTDIAHCTVLDPAILSVKPLLSELTLFGASRKATLHFQITITKNGLDLDVDGGKELDAKARIEAAQIARAHDLARLTWAGETIAGRHRTTQSFGMVDVDPPSGAFLQATEHGETVLTAAVQEALGNSKRVVDLFSGCGTFSLPIARQAEVWALEGDKTMSDALDAGWRNATGLKRVTAEMRDLFRRPVLAAELTKFEGAIIDPPRAGAEAQTRELAKSGVARIAAVSCNPISFARDTEILIDGGYRLDWVQPVDQFRWSTHVELAAQFTKGHMATK